MTIASALTLFALSVGALAQPGPRNLGFQIGEPGKTPDGWFVPQTLKSAGYSAELRREGCKSGPGCAVVLVPPSPPPNTFGNLMQGFPADPYRGKTVRLRAWLRLEAVDPQDRAQMWLRVDRANRQMGFFDNMGDRPVRSAEWTSCEITGDVDVDAQYINIGVMSIGKGGVWIEEVSFEIVQENASKAENDAARAAIQKLYTRIDAGYEKGTIEDLAALALPDAQVSGAAMKTPFRTMLDEIKAQIAKGNRFSSRSTITSLRLQGNDAIAMVRNETTLSSAGEKQAYVPTDRDTWTRVDGGWKLKETAPLSMRPVATPTSAEDVKRLAAELKQRAVPLTTVEAGHGCDDLEAFGKAVGNARIVALGEATHGTREFFQMKHRLLEYLVNQKGFTVFAIEANWPESLAVDRYIKTGEGDPKAALAGMYFWTWNTEEILAMIEWMRAYNRAPGAHPTLRFTSFDMQTAKVAMEQALDYLWRVSPGDVTADAQAESLVKLLDAKRETFLKASSLAAWRDARQAAEVARQAAVVKTAGSGYRDEMMARNTEWLATEVHPNEKIVLWAHNGHVRFATELGVKSMGVWLREKYGRQMYVVGFAFRRGEVRAIGMEKGRFSGGLTSHTVSVFPEGNGDSVLSAAGMPLLFLNLRAVPAATPLGHWLAEPHLFLGAGAGWVKDNPDSNFRLESLAKSSDGLIFVEESHAARGVQSR